MSCGKVQKEIGNGGQGIEKKMDLVSEGEKIRILDGFPK